MKLLLKKLDWAHHLILFSLNDKLNYMNYDMECFYCIYLITKFPIHTFKLKIKLC